MPAKNKKKNKNKKNKKKRSLTCESVSLGCEFEVLPGAVHQLLRFCARHVVLDPRLGWVKGFYHEISNIQK
jgi:hypothetical protein